MNQNLFYFTIFFIFSLFLSLLIFGASYFISQRNDDVEKLTAYECGFNPYDDARKIFDVKFYLVALLFIIFDLEAMFLFPYVVSIGTTFTLGFYTMLEFLIELIIGYIYVWCVGALDWH